MDFKIVSGNAISDLFLERKINSFIEACDYIRNLPYRRNKNKYDLRAVFEENCGTCSTKHALLKQLANENKSNNIRLMLGIFKMTKTNTPEVAQTLEKYGLEYIPEAHNYLKTTEETIDCTKPNFKDAGFKNYLLNEIEIQPEQITNFKVQYHQNFLKNWLTNNPEIKYSFEEIWKIREQCIVDLGNN